MNEINQVLAVIGYCTIWFTPIIFIVNLVGVMKAIKEGRETKKYTVLCCISFMLITITIVSMVVNIPIIMN